MTSLAPPVPPCQTDARSQSRRVVIAGTDSGGICAWDLDNPTPHQRHESTPAGPTAVLRPAYSTESTPWATHYSPIVSVRRVPASPEASASADADPKSCTRGALAGASPQRTLGRFLSLDASGRVCLWAVQEAPSHGAIALEMHLSEVPLGRASLFRGPRGPVGTERDLGMDLLRGDAAPCFDMAVRGGELAAASGSGAVLRGSWGGRVGAPREFKREEPWVAACLERGGGVGGEGRGFGGSTGGLGGGVECRAVVWRGELVVAGYADGSVAVFVDRWVLWGSLWFAAAAVPRISAWALLW